MFIFAIAAVTFLVYMLDIIINAGGFNTMDLLCLFVMTLTLFFSLAHTDNNYVKVNGQVRKVVYCEPERINRIFDDKIRDAMTWDSYWNFVDDA